MLSHVKGAVIKGQPHRMGEEKLSTCELAILEHDACRRSIDVESNLQAAGMDILSTPSTGPMSREKKLVGTRNQGQLAKRRMLSKM
jgi:hypothetical protein